MRFDRIGCSIVIASAITLSAAPARADDGQSAPSALVTVHRFLRDEPSADPDRATLRYGILGGRWEAMAGQRVVLAGGSLAGLRAAITLEGFIELVNFTDQQPVPWESFRANVGLDTLWEAPRLARAILPPGGRLHLAIGWFHESDHAASLQSYMRDYLLSSASFARFDNANFSAYEYVKLRLAWQQVLWGGRVTAQTTLGARLFPPPINPDSIRRMRWAFLSDVRVSVRAKGAFRPFFAGYFELVGNGFVAADEGFRGGRKSEPLRYRTISAGLDLRAAGGAIMSPEIVYSSSHGRGIDFPRFYGPELGFRLSILL